ncbi:MAG: hypothetical protein J6Y28_09175 [Acholeplasmatales bacterium]|nr:hypothetical protein [Acholeplasmatales bacterium]
MDIKKITIDLPTKETMLFVTNTLFNFEYSKNLSKKKLLDKAKEIYQDEENVLKLVNVLSNDAYLKLELIYKDFKDGKNVELSFNRNHTNELIDLMFFYVEEIKYTDNSFDIKYVYNESTFNKLDILFSESSKEKVMESNLFEKVVKGLLNTYGVIRLDYFVTFINNYLDKNYNETQIFNLIYDKLVLNQLVERFTINWKNINEVEEYVSFMEYNDDLALIAESQKQLNFEYNIHDLDYILDKSETVIDEESLSMILEIKKYNKKIKDDEMHNFVKDTLLGSEKAIKKLEHIMKNVKESDMNKVLQILTNWHNDLEIYPLCGYSPNSLKEENLVN